MSRIKRGLQSVVQSAKEMLNPRRLLSVFDKNQYAVLGPAARTGLKDVQDVVLQAFPDSKQSRDEPGTIANPTQREVYENKNKMNDPMPRMKLPSPDLDKDI